MMRTPSRSRRSQADADYALTADPQIADVEAKSPAPEPYEPKSVDSKAAAYENSRDDTNYYAGLPAGLYTATLISCCKHDRFRMVDGDGNVKDDEETKAQMQKVQGLRVYYGMYIFLTLVFTFAIQYMVIMDLVRPLDQVECKKYLWGFFPEATNQTTTYNQAAMDAAKATGGDLAMNAAAGIPEPEIEFDEYEEEDWEDVWTREAPGSACRVVSYGWNEYYGNDYYGGDYFYPDYYKENDYWWTEYEWSCADYETDIAKQFCTEDKNSKFQLYAYQVCEECGCKPCASFLHEGDECGEGKAANCFYIEADDDNDIEEQCVPIPFIPTPECKQKHEDREADCLMDANEWGTPLGRCFWDGLKNECADKMECFDSYDEPIAGCSCHESCDTCGYSDLLQHYPPSESDCITCADGGSVTPAFEDLTGKCDGEQWNPPAGCECSDEYFPDQCSYYDGASDPWCWVTEACSGSEEFEGDHYVFCDPTSEQPERNLGYEKIEERVKRRKLAEEIEEQARRRELAEEIEELARRRKLSGRGNATRTNTTKSGNATYTVKEITTYNHAAFKNLVAKVADLDKEVNPDIEKAGIIIVSVCCIMYIVFIWGELIEATWVFFFGIKQFVRMHQSTRRRNDSGALYPIDYVAFLMMLGLYGTRIYMACILSIYGNKFILISSGGSTEDLILNCLAITFLIDLPGVLFEILADNDIKSYVQNLAEQNDFEDNGEDEEATCCCGNDGCNSNDDWADDIGDFVCGCGMNCCVEYCCPCACGKDCCKDPGMHCFFFLPLVLSFVIVWTSLYIACEDDIFLTTASIAHALGS